MRMERRNWGLGIGDFQEPGSDSLAAADTFPRSPALRIPSPGHEPRLLRRRLAARLRELLADHLALERREVVDEQLAGEVVHLVLDAHRQQAVGLHLERLSV